MIRARRQPVCQQNESLLFNIVSKNYQHRVIRSLTQFVEEADIIVANRMTQEPDAVRRKENLTVCEYNKQVYNYIR